MRRETGRSRFSETVAQTEAAYEDSIFRSEEIRGRHKRRLPMARQWVRGASEHNLQNMMCRSVGLMTVVNTGLGFRLSRRS